MSVGWNREQMAARRIDHIEALWDETEVFLGE